jgi:predicted ATPase/DNA-binding CsgD family transcriptional regulator
MVGADALIGRDFELAALEHMQGSARLVTVTGTGGCGKTSLARALAERARAGPNPREVVVAELAGVRHAEQVTDSVLRAAGGRERFGKTPIEVLGERLAGRAVLLVLDNCEHLVEEVRVLTAGLLEAAPELGMVVTSREPLAVAGEAVFRLGALSLPEGDDVASVVRSDAGRLFVDRAVRVDPGFALSPSSAREVARICRGLDGLPLAIVLAASRAEMVSVSEMTDGITRPGPIAGRAGGTALPQHRSVQSSLDWSYRLLDEQERTLFRRLAAFTGGFTATSARAVALPEESEEETLRLLRALATKGLLDPLEARNEERWTLLRTVGEYAAEQLALAGEQRQAADRHLAWFRALASDADGRLLDHGHERIEQETPDLRSALARAVQCDAASAVSIVASLMRHWVLAEHFQEARRTSGVVMSLSHDGTDTRELAVVLSGAGLVGVLAEDYVSAIANAQHGLALLGGTEDGRAHVTCLLMSAMVLIQTGVDVEQGLANARRAVELARLHGDTLGLAYALVNAAMAEAICDRLGTVQAAYREFLSIPGASEHVTLRAWAEHASGWAEVIGGSPERALAHVDLALALEGERPSMTYFQLMSLRGHALARLGRVDEALDEATRALSWAHESGAMQAIPAIELVLVLAHLFAGDLDAAEAHALGLLEVPHLHTLVLMREALGRIALARGDAREAEAQARELELLAERSGSRRHRALAEFIAGSAAALNGEAERGRDLLHGALTICTELGLEREAVDILEELGLLAAVGEDWPRAARLAGAAAAAREKLACVPLPSTRARVEAARARAAESGVAEVWDAGWAEGQALSPADATAYSRRRRGRRDRLQTGWASLTPVEEAVANLAASGLTNPQIAAQMFISRATVKMHLSSVYRKLRVANRTELAGAMALHSAVGS